MKINVARLSEKGETFTGSDPMSILDWDPADDLIQPAGEVAYDLFAQRIGDELLVRGTVSAHFKGICARCGKPLDKTYSDPEFCLFLQIPPDAAFVDLTSELREAILLTLPTHPVCRANCQMPKQRMAKDGASTPSAWEALDQLNLSPKKARRSHGSPQKKEI